MEFFLILALAPVWYPICDFIVEIIMKIIGVEERIANWLDSSNQN